MLIKLYAYNVVFVSRELFCYTHKTMTYITRMINEYKRRERYAEYISDKEYME